MDDNTRTQDIAMTVGQGIRRMLATAPKWSDVLVLSAVACIVPLVAGGVGMSPLYFSGFACAACWSASALEVNEPAFWKLFILLILGSQAIKPFAVGGF